MDERTDEELLAAVATGPGALPEGRGEPLPTPTSLDDQLRRFLHYGESAVWSWQLSRLAVGSRRDRPERSTWLLTLAGAQRCTRDG
jgi:hypothetical protein